jgi:hypothetical protein
MGPGTRILIGFIALACGTGGFVAGRLLLRPSARVAQPIAFNHSVHVELMECSDCHLYYSEREHSGLPSLSLCMECHEDAQTESAEEQKIRDIVAGGEPVEFRKLFRLPDHVFYSHQRHVSLGELECATCHGSIATTLTPPEEPLVRITMQFCLDCHQDRGVRDACTVCHR